MGDQPALPPDHGRDVIELEHPKGLRGRYGHPDYPLLTKEQKVQLWPKDTRVMFEKSFEESETERYRLAPQGQYPNTASFGAWSPSFVAPGTVHDRQIKGVRVRVGEGWQISRPAQVESVSSPFSTPGSTRDSSVKVDEISKASPDEAAAPNKSSSFEGTAIQPTWTRSAETAVKAMPAPGDDSSNATESDSKKRFGQTASTIKNEQEHGISSTSQVDSTTAQLFSPIRPNSIPLDLAQRPVKKSSVRLEAYILRPVYEDLRFSIEWGYRVDQLPLEDKGIQTHIHLLGPTHSVLDDILLLSPEELRLVNIKVKARGGQLISAQYGRSVDMATKMGTFQVKSVVFVVKTLKEAALDGEGERVDAALFANAAPAPTSSEPEGFASRATFAPGLSASGFGGNTSNAFGADASHTSGYGSGFGASDFGASVSGPFSSLVASPSQPTTGVYSRKTPPASPDTRKTLDECAKVYRQKLQESGEPCFHVQTGNIALAGSSIEHFQSITPTLSKDISFEELRRADLEAGRTGPTNVISSSTCPWDRVNSSSIGGGSLFGGRVEENSRGRFEKYAGNASSDTARWNGFGMPKFSGNSAAQNDNPPSTSEGLFSMLNYSTAAPSAEGCLFANAQSTPSFSGCLIQTSAPVVHDSAAPRFPQRNFPLFGGVSHTGTSSSLSEKIQHTASSSGGLFEKLQPKATATAPSGLFKTSSVSAFVNTPPSWTVPSFGRPTPDGFCMPGSDGFGLNCTPLPNDGTGSMPFRNIVREMEPNGSPGADYQTITSMSRYQGYSLEELRTVDYQQGRRFGPGHRQADGMKTLPFGKLGAITASSTGLSGGSRPVATSGLYGNKSSTATPSIGLLGQNRPANTSGLIGNEPSVATLYSKSTATTGIFGNKTSTGIDSPNQPAASLRSEGRFGAAPTFLSNDQSKVKDTHYPGLLGNPMAKAQPWSLFSQPITTGVIPSARRFVHPRLNAPNDSESPNGGAYPTLFNHGSANNIHPPSGLSLKTYLGSSTPTQPPNLYGNLIAAKPYGTDANATPSAKGSVDTIPALATGLFGKNPEKSTQSTSFVDSSLASSMVSFPHATEPFTNLGSGVPSQLSKDSVHISSLIPTRKSATECLDGFKPIHPAGQSKTDIISNANEKAAQSSLVPVPGIAADADDTQATTSKILETATKASPEPAKKRKHRGGKKRHNQRQGLNAVTIDFDDLTDEPQNASQAADGSSISESIASPSSEPQYVARPEEVGVGEELRRERQNGETENNSGGSGGVELNRSGQDQRAVIGGSWLYEYECEDENETDDD